MFANQDIENIYNRMRLNMNSIEDALVDLNQEGTITLLYADFATGFPFLTLRSKERLSPNENTHDYLCAKTYENAGVYSPNISKIQIVDHPLYYIELFDQIEHRRSYLNSILNTKSIEDLHSAILSDARKLPRTKEALESALSEKIDQFQGTQTAERLQQFEEKFVEAPLKVYLIILTVRNIFVLSQIKRNSTHLCQVLMIFDANQRAATLVMQKCTRL